MCYVYGRFFVKKNLQFCSEKIIPIITEVLMHQPFTRWSWDCIRWRSQYLKFWLVLRTVYPQDMLLPLLLLYGLAGYEAYNIQSSGHYYLEGATISGDIFNLSNEDVNSPMGALIS
ncbi:uncharacterized protein LOC132626147 isoform X2 [Lycium barbarum]|nr:uncharacterized protein LOC132626147 isoform X2 [Lycium barbarum]